MTKVFLVPEAKPRDTKHTAVIIHIIYFITNLILMARSEAEGILPIKTLHLKPANGSKVDNTLKCMATLQ